MVINRLQSVWLLIAAILMALFCYLPFTSYEVDGATVDVSMLEYPIYLILNVAICLVVLIDIFMYKNLKTQILVATECCILEIASIVCGIVLIANMEVQASWLSLLWPLLALNFTVLARIYMKKDKKLLSSYDRLR